MERHTVERPPRRHEGGHEREDGQPPARGRAHGRKCTLDKDRLRVSSFDRGQAMTRSIEALVDEQAAAGSSSARSVAAEMPRPVVTVSPRSTGPEAAKSRRALAAGLGLDLFDREIIQRIAESTPPERARGVVARREGQGAAHGLAGRDRDPQLPEPGRVPLPPLADRGRDGTPRRCGHPGARRPPSSWARPRRCASSVAAPLETRVRAVMEREGLASAKRDTASCRSRPIGRRSS